jgi:hypothetical protein
MAATSGFKFYAAKNYMVESFSDLLSKVQGLKSFGFFFNHQFMSVKLYTSV